MPQASTAYDWPTVLTFANHKTYVADAINAADASVDFSAFDIVYIVPTDTASAIPFSPTFIANPGGGVTADGAEIRAAVTFGQDMWFWGFKVLNHETGHLFSLPDLYAFAGDTHRFVGGWDLMGLISGHASGFLAWHRWKLEWLDDSQIACLTEAGESDHTLSAIETPGGTKAVVVRTGDKTAYVAEVRRATGTDSATCDEGLLVYEVDTSISTGNGPIVVQDAHPGSGTTASCLDEDDGTFELGTGEDPSFSDAGAGVTIEVTGSTSTTMTVHVTRTTSFTRLQPDATIRLGSGADKGQDVYNGTGSGQVVSAKAASGSKTFTVTVGNDGTVTDSFTLEGPGGSNGFRVTYLDGSTNVTSQVLAGTYTTPNLLPGDETTLRVKITVTPKADPGRSKTVKVTVASVGDPSAVDAVKAKVKAT
jgi:M6 family metalloprotease-like protein